MLHEQGGSGFVKMLPFPDGNDGIQFPAYALAPHPRDTRVQAEAFAKERNPAVPDAILDGFDEHARRAVSKELPRAGGVIAPFRLVKSEGDVPVRIETVTKGEARVCVRRVVTAKNAAPQSLQRPG